MMIEFKAKIEYDVASDQQVLFTIIKNNMTGEKFTLIPILQKIDFLSRNDTFIPVNFSHEADKPLITNEQFIQGILNTAWETGFRPTGFKSIADETAAIKYHLEDMRKLVFK